MKQICNDDYWKNMESTLESNGDPENPGQPCGKAFDDLDHSTICPHEELPLPLTDRERDRLFAEMFPDGLPSSS